MLKEYNVRRHYETLHADKYNNFQGQQRREKVNELLAGLKKQQSVFTHNREISDAAVKASYLIANEIAVASKPFSEGEFVKTCMLKAAEIVCPEKRQAFANIRFEGQICRSWLGHILSVSLATLPQLDSPCCKSVVHVWNHISL